MRIRVATAISVLTLATGCGGGTDGVSLEIDAEEYSAVSVRWVVDGDGPEAMATDGEVLYVVGADLRAIDPSSGSVLWSAGAEDDYALEADGGVLVGTRGSETVEVFAPFNYVLRVDRATAAVLSLDYDAREQPEPGFTPLQQPEPRTLRVEADLDGAVARTATGDVAWRIRIDEPMFDPLGALQVADVIICGLADGRIVAVET